MVHERYSMRAHCILNPTAPPPPSNSTLHHPHSPTTSISTTPTSFPPSLLHFSDSLSNRFNSTTMNSNIDLVELFENGGDLRLFETGSSSTSAAHAMVGYIVVYLDRIDERPGVVRPREKVQLVRDQLSHSGEKALKAVNKRHTEVGEVDYRAAQALSAFIDSGSISVEGIISDPGLWNTVGNLKIPCQVNIKASEAAVSTLTFTLALAGFRFMPQTNDAFLALTSVPEAEVNMTHKSLTSIDAVFNLMEERLAEVVAPPPMVPSREAVTTELMPHQKEALGWLYHRENSSDLPPFWAVKDGEYVNELSDCKMGTRPGPLRGGILADGIGTGKTLTLISLISVDRWGYENTNLEVDERALKRPKLEWSPDMDRTPKPTLVVCPPSVISTWDSELRKHTREGCTEMYLYYGESRVENLEFLKSYDIVLTTYGTLAADSKGSLSPLCRIKWWRIILDDAHVLKKANASQTLAAMCLKAERKWAVTGMIAQNRSFDLYPLVKFLEYDPFMYARCWTRLIKQPMSRAKSQAESRLKVILATLSLMRSKEKVMIDLPSKVIETCFVELSPKELELYVQVEDGRNILERSDGDLQPNYPYFLSLILWLREICTNGVFHQQDFRPLLASTNIKGLQDVSDMPDLLEKMIRLLEEEDNWECPVCISTLSDGVITVCGHSFCRKCILKSIRFASRCPNCRHPLSDLDLYAAPPDPSEAGGLSSKGICLSKLLLEAQEENPTGKSVVFSQFQKTLLSLEEPLKASGLKVLVLDTVDARRRSNIIERFNASGPDAPTVLLARLRACTGTNLTAASTVYLMEPWWNPELEDHAIDRVHRVGRDEPLKIVRLIAKNTVEERVLRVLERKRRSLGKEVFGRTDRKDKRELDDDDIRLLLGL